MKSDLVSYLRSRPFDRVLTAVRDRYVQKSGTNASVRVTSEEARALAGLLGRPVRGGRVRLDDLDAALQHSGFGCSLREALAAYFGEPLVTRAEAAAAAEAAWQPLWAGFCALDRTGWVSADAGYLRSQWRQRPEELPVAVRLVLRALAALPAPVEPLPVFAQRLAGDPHALDADRTAGRLLLRALGHLNPEIAADSEAEQRSALLAAVGLATDDVSSTVLVAGLVGEGVLLQAARAAGVSLALPLRTLMGWDRAQGWGGTAFVVENPAVFSGLLDALADRPGSARPTLVCTSGQLSLAARRLLDMLVQGGTVLHYSGDRDAAGLAIARGLQRRYGAACRLWRMDAAAGGPVYQEALLPLLVSDLLAFAASTVM